MGFVTDMKGRKREKHTRQPPYTQIQDGFFGVFVLIQCKTSQTSQTCQDGAWIISGSNGRQGHTSRASDRQEGGKRGESIEWQATLRHLCVAVFDRRRTIDVNRRRETGMTSVEVWGGKHKSHNVVGGIGFRPQGCNPIPHFPP